MKIYITGHNNNLPRLQDAKGMFLKQMRNGISLYNQTVYNYRFPENRVRHKLICFSFHKNLIIILRDFLPQQSKENYTFGNKMQNMPVGIKQMHLVV